jgi:hypothetical protein
MEMATVLVSYLVLLQVIGALFKCSNRQDYIESAGQTC